ncbi:MAG: cardiolipin synthase [Phycisphaerales bacterium]
MLENVQWAAIASTLVHVLLTAGIALRVIMRHRTSEVAMAWIILVASFPLVGAGCYLLVGEPWLSTHRAKRRAELAEALRPSIDDLERRFASRSDSHHPACRAISRIGTASGVSPALGGNRIELLCDADRFFATLIHDIDQAQVSCDLLFYIWSEGGKVDAVLEALVRARERGVRCRILIDGVGSAGSLRGRAARRARRAGVEVRASLPVGLIRGRLRRIDIRNHRKLVCIDDRLAYTGSQNMADPTLFKAGSGYGPWVDIMTRLEGPAAGQLSAMFEGDWAMEDNRTPDVTGWVPDSQAVGEDAIQVVPSGPGPLALPLHLMLVAAVHGAQHRITLTTPYFVPDDAFVSALQSAVMRGVSCAIVVPSKINGPLVALASSAYFDVLIDAGVEIHAFDGGLLHAKTAAVDNVLAIIGSANLDRRSFSLNYELSLVIHGGAAVRNLMQIHEGYIQSSRPMRDTAWMQRSTLKRIAENTARLFSPIL